jgi:hypothetical protein
MVLAASFGGVPLVVTQFSFKVLLFLLRFFERAVILLLRLTFLLSQSSELLHGRNHFGFSSP